MLILWTTTHRSGGSKDRKKSDLVVAQSIWFWLGNHGGAFNQKFFASHVQEGNDHHQYELKKSHITIQRNFIFWSTVEPRDEVTIYCTSCRLVESKV